MNVWFHVHLISAKHLFFFVPLHMTKRVFLTLVLKKHLKAWNVTTFKDVHLHVYGCNGSDLNRMNLKKNYSAK